MRSSNLPAALLRPRRQQSAPIFKTAAVMLRAHVSKTTVDKAARELFGKDHGLDFQTRAASSVATTTDSAWAGVAGPQMVSPLLQQITYLSAAASLIGRGVHVSLDGIASLRIPGRVFDPTAAAWISESAPAPVTMPSVAAGPTLKPHKILVITTFTREQAESSNIEQFVRLALSEAAAAAIDTKLLSADAETSASPGGILAGATHVTPAAASGDVWPVA